AHGLLATPLHRLQDLAASLRGQRGCAQAAQENSHRGPGAPIGCGPLALADRPNYSRKTRLENGAGLKARSPGRIDFVAEAFIATRQGFGKRRAPACRTGLAPDMEFGRTRFPALVNRKSNPGKTPDRSLSL